MLRHALLDLNRAVPGKFVMAEDNGLSYKVKSEDPRYEVYVTLKKDLSGTPIVRVEVLVADGSDAQAGDLVYEVVNRTDISEELKVKGRSGVRNEFLEVERENGAGDSLEYSDVMMKFGRDLFSDLHEALSDWRVAAGRFEHGGGWWKQTLTLREK